jgi:hypothetical protein
MRWPINGTGTITAPPGPHTIVVNGTIVINNGATNGSPMCQFTSFSHYLGRRDLLPALEAVISGKQFFGNT